MTEKNCVYLTFQLINWLSFLYNSQLNFVANRVLSGFSYGERYSDMWSEKVMDDNKKTALLGTSLSKGTWVRAGQSYHSALQVTQFAFWAIQP